MNRVLLTIVSLLLLCAFTTIAHSEEVDWYFEIILFDNGGDSCGDGGTLIFYPGTLENLKAGQKYPMYRRQGNEYFQVAWAHVQWVDLWESKVRIELLGNYDKLLMTDVVKVKCDIVKGFNFWWDKGVNWEKEKNFYDAFRAYYRAKIYQPQNLNVDLAYRRTGYYDYVTQGQAALKAKKYAAALGLFQLALRFTWAGADYSEANDGIKKCEEMMGKSNDFEDRLKRAMTAFNAKDYVIALEECYGAWLACVLTYGTEQETTAVQQLMTTVWNKMWRDTSGRIERNAKNNKAVDAYRELFNILKYAPVIDKLDPAPINKLMEKVAEKLPAASIERTTIKTLAYLASLQTEAGYFTLKQGGEPDDDAVFLTGIALAAFASARNTLHFGMFSPNVAKAWNWLLQQRKASGAFYTETNMTSHIALTYGMSELLVASGSGDVRGNVFSALRFMVTKQGADGSFAHPSKSADPFFDDALAAIALANGLSTGIFLTSSVYENFRNYAYSKIKAEDGTISSATGQDIQKNTADDVHGLGAMLAIIRGTGGNVYGTQGMSLIRRAISTKPDISRNSPTGYYFTAWALSVFPSDEWSDFRTGIMEGIMPNLKTAEGVDFPLPESKLYSSIGKTGAAVFALLAANAVYSTANLTSNGKGEK